MTAYNEAQQTPERANKPWNVEERLWLTHTLITIKSEKYIPAYIPDLGTFAHGGQPPWGEMLKEATSDHDLTQLKKGIRVLILSAAGG